MNSRISRRLGSLIAGLTLLHAPAYAQSGVIDGYTLGFVFDSRNSSIEPLVGIPGAAVLGSQLDLGLPVRQAFVSPRQNFAVALTDNGAVAASLHASDTPVTAPLGFNLPASTVAAFSPDGSTGAFYSPDEALIRIVTGLPGAPSVQRTVQAATIPGSIRLLAITNDGAQLVAATDSSAGSLARVDGDGNVSTLANPSHPSALAFAGDSRDLLVTDDVDNTVSLIQDVAGAAAVQPLAAAADGIAGPVGVNLSADGRLLVVANGGASNILVFGWSGGAVASPAAVYNCLSNPAGLGRLNGNAVFLLNSVSDSGPLWIFDGDSTTPRVLFIPVTEGSDQ